MHANNDRQKIKEITEDIIELSSDKICLSAYGQVSLQNFPLVR